MFDIIKKSLLFGLGTLSATAEKVEEVVDELIKRGEIEKEKRSEAIKDLVEKGKEQEKLFEEKVKNEVQKIIKNLGLVTQADLKKLEKKVDALKK